MSFLVLHSYNHPAGKKESWLFFLNLLLISYRCHMAVIVHCLFPTVLWVDLHYELVAFPGHTNLLFVIRLYLLFKFNMLLYLPFNV